MDNKPFPISSQLRPDNCFIALASINTAVDNISKEVATLAIPFILLPSSILPSIAVAAASSKNNVPIPANEFPSCSGSIVDSTAKAAANIPTAAAIFNNVLAFKFF